jgi:hypothetical protein
MYFVTVVPLSWLLTWTQLVSHPGECSTVTNANGEGSEALAMGILFSVMASTEQPACG